MLSFPLIVFTDKVTDTHTHTDKSDHNTPSHFMWRGKNEYNVTMTLTQGHQFQ